MADRDPGKVTAHVDWREVARLVLTSRELDRMEEQELVPAKKVLYQFPRARPRHGAGAAGAAAQGRRRRLRLLPVAAAAAVAWRSARRCARVGHGPCRRLLERPRYRRRLQLSEPRRRACHADGGGVGAQYTPAVGWAQAIKYKQHVLDEGPLDSIAVVLGGDASCATGGFWSALTIATTQQLAAVNLR